MSPLCMYFTVNFDQCAERYFIREKLETRLDKNDHRIIHVNVKPSLFTLRFSIISFFGSIPLVTIFRHSRR